MAYDVTSLPNYVEEKATDLLAKSMFTASSVNYVTIQTGVKGDTSLNILDVDVTFQDGKSCGFEAEGDDKFTQRVIAPEHVKINKEWCDKDLIGKYSQYLVTSAATGKKLPFEEDLMNGVTAGISEGIETAMWQGTLGSGTGFSYIGSNEAGYSVQEDGSKTIWTLTKDAYLHLPAEVLGKNDLVCFMAPDKFEELVFELTDLNLYHYNPTDEDGVITMPGTNVKIVRTPGLVNDVNGVEAMFARKSNLFYGVDTEGDSADFDLWYSKDNRTFRLAVEFVIGTQIAFPNEIAVIKK